MSSITTLGINSFSNSGITTVSIPESITYIGDNTFENCTQLNTMKIGIITPLPINANVFNGVNTSSVTLYVPCGNETMYKSLKEILLTFLNLDDIFIKVFCIIKAMYLKLNFSTFKL